MIKLTNILTEVLNTFQVEADILSDRKTNISDILDQIRGLYKVTIVNNITPEDNVIVTDIAYMGGNWQITVNQDIPALSMGDTVDFIAEPVLNFTKENIIKTRIGV